VGAGKVTSPITSFYKKKQLCGEMLLLEEGFFRGAPKF